jgi:hypothetical protein
VIAIILASAALYSIARGHVWYGLAIAVALALLLTKVTYKAFKRSRP